MSEIVLGTGQQRSLREVVRMVERELQEREGSPREVHLKAGPLRIVARRRDFATDFDDFTISAESDSDTASQLRTAAAGLDGACTLVEEDGVVVIQAPPEGAIADSAALGAVDKLAAAAGLPEVWRVAGEGYRIEHISIELLFQAMIKYKASDVHLAPGESPVFRVDNDTRHSEILGALSGSQIRALVEEMAPGPYWDEFLEDKQTSFNFHQIGLGYARVSAFQKSGAPHCTLRFLPETIPSFDDLNVPRESMEKLAELHRGLVLVTGMTGSGKSTTAAALIDWINAHKALHILTIENPVEYVHHNKRSIVSQRSLGEDIQSFYLAVTGALRHDPDVIFIGEMRDPDTIRAAINAAATGHLVISTLHSNTASEVINRIVSFFDPIERDLVKLQLHDSLQCVICQRLVPKVGGGRLPALEMLFKDVKPISDGIKAGNTEMIRIGMQQSVTHSFIFEKYLYNLYKKQLVTLESARENCTDVSVFDQLHMGTYSVPRLDSIKHTGAI